MEGNKEGNPEEPESESDSESEEENCSLYDFITKEVIAECELKPTNVDIDTMPWLYALNNKFEDEGYDSNFVGKWMVFVSSSEVNDLWIRTKEAIKNGHLWNCKVSTKRQGRDKHVIIIYTKDYTDIQDVIDVLNYLEQSGIKPREVIHYKSDNQTRAGIYWTTGCRGLSIYSSDTIRETRKPNSILSNSGENNETINADAVLEGNCAMYDFITKNVISECDLNPTDINKDVSDWLWARNNKHTRIPNMGGKWMLFVKPNRVDDLWIRIKKAIKEGHLWQSKVSTRHPRPITDHENKHAIMIYTKDYTDVEDVIEVLDYLEQSGIKPQEEVIRYKTNNQTRAGVYRGGKQRPWIYSSDTIRESRGPHPTNSSNDTNADLQKDDDFLTVYDFTTRDAITECELKPTDIDIYVSHWLYAYINNNTDYDSGLVGKWMLFVPSFAVDDLWVRIKQAIKENHLWKSKVSTKNPEQDAHVIMIYTVDYTDIQDVIDALDYLEKSGIKPREKVIYYKTDSQTRAKIHRGGNKRPWIYASNKIRELREIANAVQEVRKTQPHSANPNRTNYSNETNQHLSWRKDNVGKEQHKETRERAATKSFKNNRTRTSNDTNEYLSWRKRPSSSDV